MPRDAVQALRAVGAVVIAGVAVTLLAVDPAQTVTSDLPRLYAQMGASAMGFVGTALAWAAAALWALRAGAAHLRGAGAGGWSGVAAAGGAAALLGAIVLSSVVPGILMGVAAYTQAEDGGFAPPTGSLGPVLAAVWTAGLALLAVGALLAAVRRLTAPSRRSGSRTSAG